jgi:hypothetical protein
MVTATAENEHIFHPGDIIISTSKFYLPGQNAVWSGETQQPMCQMNTE